MEAAAGPGIKLRSEWVQASSGKHAIVTAVGDVDVWAVYDRVDDPEGPASQYGSQRVPAAEFFATHRRV